MIYKKYEIVAEAIQERAEYSLDDDGHLYDYLQSINSDPEITAYGIVEIENGDIIDWTDTLDEAKKYIDKLTKE